MSFLVCCGSMVDAGVIWIFVLGEAVGNFDCDSFVVKTGKTDILAMPMVSAEVVGCLCMRISNDR